MAFLAIDPRDSVSQYDRIFCQEDSDNLWASLLKGKVSILSIDILVVLLFANTNY